jgi:hypothetical protein
MGSVDEGRAAATGEADSVEAIFAIGNRALAIAERMVSRFNTRFVVILGLPRLKEGYSESDDLEYRRLRAQLVSSLRQRGSGDLAQHADAYFPVTLFALHREMEPYRWDREVRYDVDGVRAEWDRIKSVLLDEFSEADLAAPTGAARESVAVSPTVDPASNAAASSPPRLNQAQRRSQERKAHAIELRKQGKTLDEIRRELGLRHVRQVQNYLRVEER